MSNWDTMIQFFQGGENAIAHLPGSEYLWAIVIVAVSITGFVIARKMVYKV